MKLVIGLIGEQGAGKETVGNLLLNFTAAYEVTARCHRFSDVLSETLDLWGISRTREHLQNLAIAMDNIYGKGALTVAVKNRAIGVKEDVVILDGVRWRTDFDMIRSIPSHLLVYVTADQRKRYDRVLARKGAGAKVGESTLTFDAFCEAERKPNEVLIPLLGKQADALLENNDDDWDDKLKISWTFSGKVRDMVKTLVLPRLGVPVS